MHDGLRALAREAEGRQPEPSAAIIDSQTAWGTGVGGPARSYDPAKRTAGRKRHTLVDAAGQVLVTDVHAADFSAGCRLSATCGAVIQKSWHKQSYWMQNWRMQLEQDAIDGADRA